MLSVSSSKSRISAQILRVLHTRRFDRGSAEHPDTGYRPDSTAWSILALSTCNIDKNFISIASLRLTDDQLPDGRVALSAQHPGAYWPTALAVLAWQKADQCYANRSKAMSFLLSAEGKHWPREKNAPVAHDSAIVGWPWIANTHSWIEPTSLALVALKACGLGRHPRAIEARKLLLDRQLPGGGWNYGNTIVYGQKLDPMFDSTGLALEALAGDVDPSVVDSSLAYLERHASRLATPQSLGWCILGLSAWQRRPQEAETLIANCLDRQNVYGAYGTSHLSLLLLALCSRKGLTEALLTEKSAPHGY